MIYNRPIAQTDVARPSEALPLAGGWAWFTHVELLSREAPPRIVPHSELAPDVLTRLTAPRPDFAGLSMARPQIMGILNVTPDSFSDGGQHDAPEAARAHAAAMTTEGADLIDVGGESTRPGSETVPDAQEIARTAPVIAALKGGLPLSIDTRKSAVAAAALDAGATIVNDVSGFTYDPALAPLCAARSAPICIMHAQGDPQTMQQNPRYADVLLDVFDFLAARLAALEALGIPRAQMMVDPGIGFGKTQAHNLALLARLSLFHALGVPVLLGVSRKRFIGTLGKAPEPAHRVYGSVALAQAAVGQGVQMIRVHDVFATRSALSLWSAQNA